MSEGFKNRKFEFLDFSFNYLSDKSLKNMKHLEVEILWLLGNNFTGNAVAENMLPLLEERSESGITILKIGQI